MSESLLSEGYRRYWLLMMEVFGAGGVFRFGVGVESAEEVSGANRLKCSSNFVK